MNKIVTFIAGKDPLETTVGGHSSYVRAHARAAVQAGFEPHLFCASHDSGIVETEYGFIHRVRSPLRFIFKRKPTSFGGNTMHIHRPLVAGVVERFLQAKTGPHLIHSFGKWVVAGIKARDHLRRRGIRAVLLASAYATYLHETIAKVAALNSGHSFLYRCSMHTQLLFEKAWNARLEESGYLGADLVLVNYKSVEDIITSQCGPGVRFRKGPYTSEVAFTRKNQITSLPVPDFIKNLQPADAPLIVTVARHDPRKGLGIFLRALVRLKEAGAKFRACMIGTGPLLEHHRQLVAQLGLGDSVMVAGFVEDPFAYLLHANIFVLPSTEESSGSVALIEAMQARTAIVASGVDGIPEDVTDGETGLLVRPGDEGQLTAAIGRLLGDAELRQRLARNAGDAFLRQFSPDVLAESLRAIYAELGFT